MSSYTPTIGLEVHAELKTKSKMFCSCANDPHDAEANTHICPVCTAQPGTLPVPNESAIKMVLMFGVAVGAEAATYSEFDRKNYFYPDIPKAYQISQYAFPFLTGGKLEGVALTRVHLEEDTARSQHDKGSESLVDFNRAGVPLMELVTEPVVHDAKTAGDFARELQLLLRTLDISDANMERGEMRVEANISVSKDCQQLGTKVEVKNLNSFKAVESAIEYEVARQIELLESGEVVQQETRGWDESRAKTFSQRSKETAKDYRYFPDPDIPKLAADKYTGFNQSSLLEIIPELPSKKRDFYNNLGLASDTIELLVTNLEYDSYFKKVLPFLSDESKGPKLAANYLISDVSSLLSDKKFSLTDLSVRHFAELISLLAEDKIGSRVAKDLLERLFGSSVGPLVIAERENLLQLSDASALSPVVAEILSENPAVVAEYKGGKEAALQFLLGQGMKKTRGSANPKLLREALLKALK